MKYIVELRPVISVYSSHEALYPLYHVYPLRSIIQTILMMKPYDDHMELFWIELDNRLSILDSRITFDIDTISVWVECLTEHLDTTIRQAIPISVDSDEYSFQSWLGTSVILGSDYSGRESFGDNKFTGSPDTAEWIRSLYRR